MNSSPCDSCVPNATAQQSIPVRSPNTRSHRPCASSLPPPPARAFASRPPRSRFGPRRHTTRYPDQSTTASNRPSSLTLPARA
eukprot:1805441-Rhodomonas_salina.1